MKEILDQIQQMRKSRGWDKTDTNPILAKSVVIEASELLECFQFDENNYDLEEVKKEVADILMYTLSICIDNNFDVKQIIEEKIKDVEQRYPKI